MKNMPLPRSMGFGRTVQPLEMDWTGINGLQVPFPCAHRYFSLYTANFKSAFVKGRYRLSVRYNVSNVGSAVTSTGKERIK